MKQLVLDNKDTILGIINDSLFQCFNHLWNSFKENLLLET